MPKLLHASTSDASSLLPRSPPRSTKEGSDSYGSSFGATVWNSQSPLASAHLPGRSLGSLGASARIATSRLLDLLYRRHSAALHRTAPYEVCTYVLRTKYYYLQHGQVNTSWCRQLPLHRVRGQASPLFTTRKPKVRSQPDYASQLTMESLVDENLVHRLMRQVASKTR